MPAEKNVLPSFDGLLSLQKSATQTPWMKSLNISKKLLYTERNAQVRYLQAIPLPLFKLQKKILSCKINPQRCFCMQHKQ
jgi:hypothetical protein